MIDHERIAIAREWLRDEAQRPRLIGRAPAWLAVLEAAAKASIGPACVLLTGETGTGKGMLAAGLHELAGPPGAFVRLNCSELKPETAESQIFGHIRGAFTGATDDRDGYVHAARDGTLFLDEFGDLSPQAQAAILCWMDDWMARRFGGAEEAPERVRCRVIAATNRPLGVMRDDLLARFDVHLRVPALRERPGDVPVLAAAFLRRQLAGDYGGAAVELTADAVAALCAREWGANVRGLEKAIGALIRSAIWRGAGAVEAADVDAELRPESPMADGEMTGEMTTAHEIVISPSVSAQSPPASPVVEMTPRNGAGAREWLRVWLALHGAVTVADVREGLALPLHTAQRRIRAWASRGLLERRRGGRRGGGSLVVYVEPAAPENAPGAGGGGGSPRAGDDQR